jgi:predicted transcriptional regulator
MDILYRRGEATIAEICEDLPSPPSTMAARRMIQILDEKNWLKRHKVSREFVYQPRRAADKAGASALEHVLQTYFSGSLEAGLTARYSGKRSKAKTAELTRLKALLGKL